MEECKHERLSTSNFSWVPGQDYIDVDCLVCGKMVRRHVSKIPPALRMEVIKTAMERLKEDERLEDLLPALSGQVH